MIPRAPMVGWGRGADVGQLGGSPPRTRLNGFAGPPHNHLSFLAGQVIAIASRLKIEHVDEVEISLRLLEHSSVRRFFFRSPDDGDVRPDVDQVGQLINRIAGSTNRGRGLVG
jgi:hypothetical protein